MPPTSQKRQLTPTSELIAEAERRRGEHGERISAYKKFLDAYFGEDASTRLRMITSDADGRPAMRVSSDIGEGWAKRGNPNYIQPMVDDFVALRGLMPNVTVPAASGKPEDKERAVKITRILREQIEHSHMDIKQPTAAFYLSCLGETCYVLDPRTPADFEKDPDPFRPIGIEIAVVSPEHAFPKFKYGTDQLEVEDLFLFYRLSVEDVEATYGISVPGDDSGLVDVIHYYSRWEKQIIVNGFMKIGVVHNLGFCPAQWVSNKATDGTYAQSDIRQSVEFHTEIQATFHVMMDSLLWSVWPIVHIRNRHNVSSDSLEIGPGATVTTINDGDVQMITPAAQPQAARLIHDTQVDALRQMVGTTPIRQEGIIDRSNVSARSVDRQQGPMENRLTLSNTMLGACWKRLNSKMLLMLSNIEALKTAEMSMYGQDRSGIYNETFTGADVGGWVRNEVKWDSMLGSSRHERVAVALQMFKEGQGKYPWRRVLEEAGEEDPQALLEEAHADMAAAAEAQGAMPMGPQAPPSLTDPTGAGGRPHGAGTGHPHIPMPPGANTAASMQANAEAVGNFDSMEGVVQPHPPQAEIPPFAPVDMAPSAQGMGSPAPIPNVMGLIRDAISSLKLYGAADAEPSANGIHVKLTDHRDVAQVKQALKPVAQQIFGPKAIVSTEILKGS